jgi:hypothetical protein
MSDRPEESAATRVVVRDPFVIIFQNPESQERVYGVHRTDDSTLEHYALLVCELVGHVAQRFDVDVEAVWDAIEAEREVGADIIEPS